LEPKKKAELLLEMKLLKKEEKSDLCFLAIVDIVKLKATLLICGYKEAALAEKVFGGKVANEELDLGKKVSRKKDYIPPLSSTVQGGWTPPPEEKEQQSKEQAELEHAGELYMDHGDHGCVLKRRHNIRHLAQAVIATQRFMNMGDRAAAETAIAMSLVAQAIKADDKHHDTPHSHPHSHAWDVWR